MKQFHKYTLDGDKCERWPAVYYDIKDNVLYVKSAYGETSRKIVESQEFLYQFQKTQVKAIEGAEGLKCCIDKFNSPDSPFNSRFFWLLHNLTGYELSDTA